MTCVKVELTRQNQKAGVTLFAMNKITQTMQFRQAVIEYSNKYGVTAAAIRYRLNRQYIYRWRKRYDGTLQSLNRWQTALTGRIIIQTSTHRKKSSSS